MNLVVLGALVGLVVLVPIGLKWNLRLRTVAPVAVLVGLASGGIVFKTREYIPMSLMASVAAEIALIVVISAALLLWRFYRDPERRTSVGDGTFLAPADGRIVYVKRVESGMFAESEKNHRKYPLRDFLFSDLLQQSGTLIGIAMNFLDVHVNRSPVDGRIVALHSINGGFKSLRKNTAALLNQRQIVIIDDGKFLIAVVQIASRLVRGIISFKNVGERVNRGERIGAIRFGSQVDLFVPDNAETQIDVRVGQHVKAGLTVLATCKQALTHRYAVQDITPPTRAFPCDDGPRKA